MAGIARLALAAGHHVTGSDKAAYPPMSEQLAALGIQLELGLAVPDKRPDLMVVGNAMTRGMPVIEHMLNAGWPYVSGPDWLHKHVLATRQVLAIAGTHGKTSTSSMLAWILQQAGVDPGFLIGGVPGNFAVSARLGSGPFVLEADEYDTAFFDKRAKFVHYPASVFVINNLEHDHADIYPNVDAIVRQFHHAIRALPGNARIIRNANSTAIDQLIDQGCWTPVSSFEDGPATANWGVQQVTEMDFTVVGPSGQYGRIEWAIPGSHNRQNALAAIAAADAVGIDVKDAAQALNSFKLPARRLELRHQIGGVRVLLDFAHHPTAIATTIDALQGAGRRVLIAVEPRSNTMRAGVHGDRLPKAMRAADYCCFLSDDTTMHTYGIDTFRDPLAAANALAKHASDGDLIVLMSNGNLTDLADLIANELNSL